jgi:hypothetical protein
VLRWLLFEAAKTSARSSAPGHRYYSDVKDRYDANRASLSQARRITGRPRRPARHLGRPFVVSRKPIRKWAPLCVKRRPGAVF